jgi:hypothetical protein
MDNCLVHKVAGVKEAIEPRGAKVEYLPSFPNGPFLLYAVARVLSYFLCRMLQLFPHAGYVSI